MIRFCTDRPRLVLAIVMLVTALFGWAAAGVRVDPSVEAMLPESDADGIYYMKFLERFGSDEVVFVALRLPHAFGPKGLAAVQRISEGMRKIALEPEAPGGARVALIDRVISPTTVTYPRGSKDADGESTLVLEPLVRGSPQTEAAEKDLWQRATSDPLIARNLISPASSEGPAGASTVLILGRIVDRPGDLTYRTEITRQVRSLVAAELARDPSLGATASIAGMPVLKSEIADLTLSEILRVDPLEWVVNALIVFFLFRKLRAMALALIVAGVSLVWTVGLLTLLGSCLNVLSIVILGIVKALAVVTSIHVLAGYRNRSSSGGERREIARAAAKPIALPSFISTLTTSLGCMALATTGISAMTEVGLYTSFGVMVGWALSMTLLPAMLALHSGRELRSPASWLAPRIGEGLARLIEPALARPVWTTVIVLAPTAVMALGVLRLHVESNLMALFDANHPLRAAYDQIGAEVSGIQPLEISLRTAPGHALDPSVLARVEELQKWLESQPRIDKTISIVDYLKRMNGAVLGDGSESGRLPETAAQAQTLLFLAESQDRSDPTATWLQPSWEDPTYLRVTVRHRIFAAEDISALVEASRAHLAEELLMRDDVNAQVPVALEPGEIGGGVTGVLVLYANMRNLLLGGQWKSWLIALSVIWVALIAATRSIRIGSIAMLPNIFPTVMMFGFMGWAGIPLDFATGLTAAVCTSIADDDTIHVLSSYRVRLSAGVAPRDAIRGAIRDVGPVILLAGCILAAGFFMFLAASFAPLFYFGVLAGTTVLTGLLFDLVLMPALLCLGHRDGK